MVTARARRLEPGQLVQGMVRIRNSGTRPTIFAVRVTPGSSGILGFSSEAASRTVLTPRAVGPGDTVTVPVSIRLPETPGAKSFQIAVGEADPSGMLTRVLDTQIFANLAEIISGIPVVPPGPVPTPSPTPQQLAAQFRDALGTPSVSVSPREVTVGQSVRAFVQVPTNAPFTFSPRIRLFLIDRNRQQVRSLVDQLMSVPRAQTIVRQVDISTTGLTPDQQYGLRLSLVDPTTGLVLLDPLDVTGLFQVRSAAAPPAPPPPPSGERIEPIPEIESVPPPPLPPQAGPSTPQLISIAAPTLTPITTAPGGVITGSWTLRNPLTQAIRAFLFLDGPGGGNGVARDFDPSETVTLRVIGQVPQAQPPGSVTYGLAVRDVRTNQTIANLVRTVAINVQLPTTARAPAPAPTPTPAPPPSAQGIRPGELVMFPPSAQPLTVARTQTVTLLFSVNNQSGVSGNLSVLAFPRDPTGRTRGTLRATVLARDFGSTPFELSYQVPQDAASGSWSVQAFLWDPRTLVAGDSTSYLVRETFQGVFTVR